MDFVIEEGCLVKYTGPGGDIVIPEGVTDISSRKDVFPDVEFTSVYLPNSLKRSLWWGWAWPRNIKTEAYVVSPEHPLLTCFDGVVYDKELTEILACPLLKKGELLLPKTFLKSSNGVLDQAYGITAFRVDPEHKVACSYDGLTYSKDKTTLAGCPVGKTGTVTLAAETEKIIEGALDGCIYVTEYVVPPENIAFKDIDGVLYNKSGSQLLKYPAGRKGEFVVPDHVVDISQSAFDHAVGLTKLTIPPSVQKFHHESLKTADNLKTLIMPTAAYISLLKLCDCVERVDLTGEDYYYSHDGVIFRQSSSGEKNLIYCPRGRSDAYTVPDGITEIHSGAFTGCKNLPQIDFAGNFPKMHEGIFCSCQALHIPSQYLRIADKVPVAFSVCAKYFEQADLQWLAVYQTAKGWKEVLEHYIAPLDKAEFFQGMLDLLAEPKKIPKAQGMNVVEFVQRWTADLPYAQIRRLREILTDKKCSAAVKAMDEDSRLQKILSGEDSAEESTCRHPVELLVRDHWENSKVFRDMQQRIRAGIPYQDNGKICHPDVLVYIMAAYAQQMDDNVRFYSMYKTEYVRSSKHPVADQAAQALDREAFLNFLEEYAVDKEDSSAYGPALDGSLIAFGRYASPKQISKLISSMRKWEKCGPTGRKSIIIARGGLMLSDTREAILAVDKVNALGYYAKIRGTSAEIIRDTVLADFGLDEDGKKVCDLGNGHSVEIRLHADLSLGLFDLTANKAVKSIPKKGADPQCYAEVSACFTDMKKNAKKIAKSRSDQLFQAFLDAAYFDAASWKKTYLENPLLRQVAGLLIWEQKGLTFTILNREIITHDESTVALTNDPIRLAHPMEMDAVSVESWQKYFTARGLKQMFPQVWEPVFAPDSVQKDRYHGYTVPVLTLAGQKKHGMGVDDLHAYSDSFYPWLTECSIEAEPSEWRYVPGMNDDFFFTLGDFTFRRYTRWTNHIVGWFDRYLIVEKIKKDDVSVDDMLPGFTLAQITEFIKIAAENSCANVMAVLLEHKNQHFTNFDPMEEFSLDL